MITLTQFDIEFLRDAHVLIEDDRVPEEEPGAPAGMRIFEAEPPPPLPRMWPVWLVWWFGVAAVLSVAAWIVVTYTGK